MTEEKKGKSVSGEVIKLKRVRLSFPSLDKPTVPQGYDNTEPAFNASALLDPKDPGNRALIKQCQAEIKRLIALKWPNGVPPKFKGAECFGKGEKFTSSTTGKPYDGYVGMYAIAAKNKKRPLCLDREKNILTPEEVSQILYAGCYVDMNINFWVQDNKFGQAIRCSLRGVRFREDGEEFGASAVTVDEFDDDFDDDDGDIDLNSDDDDLGLDEDIDDLLDSPDMSDLDDDLDDL